MTSLHTSRLALAVDIGGTKLSAALVDDTGRVIGSTRRDTPETADPYEVLHELHEAIDDLADFSTQAGGRGMAVCGVGCGGPMSMAAETVSPLNIPAWRDFPLADRLRDATGLPVYVDNDAKALALGEWWAGTAVGERHFLAMVVSTGVGGGIVVDGHLLDGVGGNAGHVGHVIVEPSGRPCGCGARGCLEAEASGTAIRAMTGEHPSKASAEIVERTGRLVGRAIASVANAVALQKAIVAGSVALGYGDAFFSAAQAEIDERARLDFSRGTTVVPAMLGELGPLVGAAAVGWRGLGVTGPWSPSVGSL